MRFLVIYECFDNLDIEIQIQFSYFIIIEICIIIHVNRHLSVCRSQCPYDRSRGYLQVYFRFLSPSPSLVRDI